MTRWLTTASNEIEAMLIRDRLAEAGIRVVIAGAGNARAEGARRDILVEDAAFDDAREALRDARGEAQPAGTRPETETRVESPGGPFAEKRPGLLRRLLGRGPLRE